jgi:hypothetical protein
MANHDWLDLELDYLAAKELNRIDEQKEIDKAKAFGLVK